MEKRCCHFFSAVLDWIHFILAGNNDIHENLVGYESNYNKSLVLLLVSMATDCVIMGKTMLPLFQQLFLIRSFSYLQVMMTCMRTPKNLKFGQIQPLRAEKIFKDL